MSGSADRERDGLLLRAVGPDGLIATVDEVLRDGPPKRRRRCTCYSCERPVVAHRESTGRHVRRAHFKHAPESNCYAATGNGGRGGEGALHLSAKLHLKSILEAMKREPGARVLRERACPRCERPRLGVLASIKADDEIRVEKIPPHQRTRYLPDLQVLRRGVPQLTIEVVYQHPCSSVKWDELRTWPGAVIEVSSDRVLEPWLPQAALLYLRAHNVEPASMCRSCSAAERRKQAEEVAREAERAARAVAAAAAAERWRLERAAAEETVRVQRIAAAERETREAAELARHEMERKKKDDEWVARMREKARLDAIEWQRQQAERLERVAADQDVLRITAHEHAQREQHRQQVTEMLPVVSRIERAGHSLGEFKTFACCQLGRRLDGTFRYVRWTLDATTVARTLEVKLTDDEGIEYGRWTTETTDRAAWLADVCAEATEKMRTLPGVDVPTSLSWIWLTT